MAEIVISVAAKVAEYLVDPIKLQFRKFTYFNSHCHVKDLIQKFDNLDHARREVEILAEEANRQGDDIFPSVQDWLQSTEGILQTREHFVQDEEQARQQGCFHLKSRYNLSRRAKRQGEDIDAKLLQARDFVGNTLSKRLPPPVIRSAFSTNDGAFPSRQSIFNQIMEALRNEQTSIVGVWGMGGVGKTTLALQVAKRAEQEKLFDKMVMASSISQNPNISEIQLELAKTLGLKFEEGEDRSVALMNSMKNQKKILVILDDIWGKIDLGKIGIPIGDDHKGCKLLLTSREYEVVVTDMKAQQVFHLPHLEEEEAWILFKSTAGDSVENLPELKDIAEEIVSECEGLPIAIITIANALKNKSVGEWKNALKELKRAKPTNIRGMSKNVYSCLELSYDHLEGDEVKSLFLLCGLLGSGHICMDHLLLYAVGLNLFKGMHSMEEATKKLLTSVQKLIASSLLLEAEGKDNDGYRSLFFDDSFVKMPNVVCHVARSIASRDGVSEAAELREWERRGEGKSYSRLCLECKDLDELPAKLVYPQLELFLLMNSSLNQLRIPDAFFQEVTKLRVLHMSKVSLRPPPSSLGFLRTLCLNECQLEGIGEMERLKALSLANSTIVELPKEMAQLMNLRVLDLQDCKELRIIPRKVISSLSRLECLSLRGCYGIEWGRDGESDNDKACLSEIKDLPLLRTLEVQISDPSLIPKEDIGLDLVNLTRCAIRIRDERRRTRMLSKFSGNLIAGGVKSPAVPMECFSSLFKTTRLVPLAKLDGITDLVYDSDQDGILQLERLKIEGCSTIRHIFSSFRWVPPPDAFCRLDGLDLAQLPDLESVFDFHESAPIPIESFGKLGCLRLRNCKKLRCVLSLPMQHGRDLTFFPRLQKLELIDLPDLISFYSTTTPEDTQVPLSIFNQQEAFPDLEILTIQTFEATVEIWRGQFSVVSFSKLKVLSITDCHGISVVISSNMIHAIHILEILEVRQCGSVIEVIHLPDETAGDLIDFTKLKSLVLDGLPNLKSFCSAASHTFRFPSLEKLVVKHCPKIEFFGKGVRPSNEDEDIEDEVTFLPKLTHLELGNLALLKMFRSQAIKLRWPLLKVLQVRDCDEVGVHSGVDAHPLFLVEKEEIPDLERLTIQTLKGAKEIWRGVSFSKLRVLSITNCNGISVVIPGNMIQKLHNLEELEVKQCGLVNEVIQLLDETTRDFTKLKYLQLDGLPDLKSFCSKTSQTFRFPSLEKLIVKDCPKMEFFCNGVKALNEGKDIVEEVEFFPKVTHVELENLCRLKTFCPQVLCLRCPLLKELYVRKCDEVGVLFEEIGPEGKAVAQPLFLLGKGAFLDLESLTVQRLKKVGQIWRGQISGEFFPKLRVLSILDCHAISVVNMVHKLHNLEELKLMKCDSVNKVVQLLDEPTIDQIYFTKLKSLVLDGLPNLKSFCSATSPLTFPFPSLEKLTVKHCPKMEYFCRGIVLHTLSLKFEGINDTSTRK